MSDGPVIKKRVQPYPIDAVLDLSGQILKGQIKKLTLLGFLVDTGEYLFKVNERLNIRFEIPVYHKEVISEVKVIKTYDQYQGANNAKTHLVEMHFIGLPESHKEVIKLFLKKIGQTLR